MKNFKKIFSLFSLVALLSSCAAYHMGTMSGSASLSQANFTYVKQNLRAKSSASYVLGIGGLGKETLVDLAKTKLVLDNPLGPNQALANVTVNFKSSWYMFLLYQQVECTVSADVVEFK